MNQIVDVLHRSEEVITVGTAAEIKEAWNLQDALNVFGCRIRFEDEIIIASLAIDIGPKAG